MPDRTLDINNLTSKPELPIFMILSLTLLFSILCRQFLWISRDNLDSCQAFEWARMAEPVQPLTTAVWEFPTTEDEEDVKQFKDRPCPHI